MKTYTETFGVAIAFVAPGVVVLWGVSQHSATVQQWFGAAAEAEVSVGGFLFVLLASLAIGVIVSGLRWAVIDPLVKKSGVTRPALDQASWNEPEKLAAFTRAVEDFYRYYQFYANMIVAALAAYVMWLSANDRWPWERPVTAVMGLAGIVLLFYSARDSLGRYYRAAERILGTTDD